ncbi:MAG: hypothetical protein KVP17_001380 [Porospora cf. gigantea B]|uniref:uncharacterized protein n=1 Tax=Porospora cf. gigantea B TaxID=2853592 RepID=UPI0035718C15|nr:MAG: hypothetical protein KVP17_001380 [Porospora cf. gigantea B]
MNEFLRLAIEREVRGSEFWNIQCLSFGDFTLKSGRKSPYFFNAGGFSTGSDLSVIGNCYAETISESGIVFDVLFGPAYKGIPLVCCAAMAMSGRLGRPVEYLFNRKTCKDHGEGGLLVGAIRTVERILRSGRRPRVYLVDDVITAGTAVREAVQLLRESGCELVGVCVLLDRQERMSSGLTALEELSRDLAIPVDAVATLTDLASTVQDPNARASLQAYVSLCENESI